MLLWPLLSDVTDKPRAVQFNQLAFIPTTPKST